MKTITDLNFLNQRALIRVDFNVPLNPDGTVADATRIDAALPTIQCVLETGGSVVLMSHLGRPGGKANEKDSLKYLVGTLQEKLGIPVQFVPDCIGPDVEATAKNLKPGEVLLLENLRFHNGEKSGDPEFAKQLAVLGDIYINDAFGTAHRKHASTSIIADSFEGKKYFGLLMERELSAIYAILKSSKRPLTAIIGGAKVSSKLPVIQSLMDKADHLIIGGGMAYTFAKAQGFEVGKSLVESEMLDEALAAIEAAKAKGVQLHLPSDTMIASTFSNEAETAFCSMQSIPVDWIGVDLGPESIQQFDAIIKSSKTILWNGPVGVFEMPLFAKGTRKIAESVAGATKLGAFSLIGGGDSVAAINQLGLAGEVSYISTGGGALLEMLEGKDLPGIAAILS